MLIDKKEQYYIIKNNIILLIFHLKHTKTLYPSYRIQRLSGERDHHKSAVLRITRQQEALEKTLAQEAEKLRQLAVRHKVTTNKLKVEKDEVRANNLDKFHNTS